MAAQLLLVGAVIRNGANTNIRNGIPVQEHANVALGVPPFLKPSESDWKNPHNHQASLEECEKQCHKLTSCEYGTYVTKDVERKGECWLAAKPGQGVPCVAPMQCMGFRIMQLNILKKAHTHCLNLKMAGVPASSPESKCNGQFAMAQGGDRLSLQHNFHMQVPEEAGHVDPDRPMYQQQCVTKDSGFDKAYTSHLVKIETNKPAERSQGHSLWHDIEDESIQESCDSDQTWKKPIREMTKTEASASNNVRKRVLYYHKKWGKWVVSDTDPSLPLHMLSKATTAKIPYIKSKREFQQLYIELTLSLCQMYLITGQMLQWYINPQTGGHYLSRDEAKVLGLINWFQFCQA